MSTGSSLLSTLMCFLCFIDLTKGQCSLQKMSDTYMREADLIDKNYGSDIECANQCLADSECWAYIFGEICKFADKTTADARFDQDGDFIYLKQCVETSTTTESTTTTTTSTTTTPSTTTTTTSTTTTTEPLTTTSQPTTTTSLTTTTTTTTTPVSISTNGNILSNTDASGQIVSLTTSSCKTACDLVLQCQHYVLDSSNVCKLFTTTPEQMSQTGSILGRKINCPDGQPCCYQTISDTNDETVPQLSFTQSFSSCQELCLKLAQCRAVVFTGTTCQLYTYIEQTSSKPGYTMYIKPDGVSSDYSVSDVCLKGSSTTPLIHLIILAVASVFLLRRSILR